MQINGLLLPEALLQILTENRWRLVNVEALAKLSGSRSAKDFMLLSIERMAAETESQRKLYRDGYSREYALYSSIDGAMSVGANFLDIERAVVIAVNWDDEAIVLDYHDRDEPRVVCDVGEGSGTGRQWNEIAPNFSAFAQAIGL